MPDTPDTSTPWPAEQCRSPQCNKPIIWTTTERMKPMPVDAQPSPDGTLALSWSANGKTVLSRVVKPAHLRFGRKDLHVSHFATCPHAERWRHGRSRRPGRG